MSCMVITVHIPRLRTASMTVCMVTCWLDMSRLFVGSSMIRISGSWTTAREICVFWNSPPLMRSVWRSDRWSMRMDSIADHGMSRSLRVAPHWMYGLLPMSTVSKTEIAPGIADWGTYAICFALSLDVIDETGSPPTSTSPDDGRWRLHMHFSSVVFPTPFGPRMETTDPRSAENDIPWRTSFSP